MADPPISKPHVPTAADCWRAVAEPAQQVAVEASCGHVSPASLRILAAVIKNAIHFSRSGALADVQLSESDLSDTGPVDIDGVHLAAREVQVLKGAAAGLSNVEIGQRLFISEHTVKTHLRRSFDKIGAQCRAHAVAIAFRAGVLR